MSSTRQKVLYRKVLLISIALALFTFSIAYCPVDDGKKTQDVAEEYTFFLITPSFVNTAQNGDNLC